MRRRSFTGVLAGAIAAFVLGAPARAWPQTSGAVMITTAQALVGTGIRSSDGHPAGLIDGVMLDIPNGDVLYVIVGSGGDLDIGTNHLPIPYGALQIDASHLSKTITVDQTVAQLRSRPPIDSARLAEFGTTQWVKFVYKTYGVPEPYGYVTTPDPAPPQAPYQAINLQPDPDRLTIIRDPSRTLAANLLGLPVLSGDGKTVGTIGEILIDLAAGRIAYLELTTPGFLNISQKWRPVAPEALTWAAGKDAFVLNGNPPPITGLHAKTYPTEISRAEIADLYRSLKLTPYWEQSPRAAVAAGQDATR